MNDIEAAEFARYWGKPSPHDASLRAVAEAAWMARSALAHAARGEGECAVVGSPEHVALWDAINEYARSVGGDPSRFKTVTRMNAVVDVEAAVREFRPTPPPATGEAGTSEVEKAALPTRGDVGRPESTRDPVFLLRWRPKKVDPGRDRWHVEGVWFTRQEAEQFAKAHAYRWGSDQFGPCWHVYCVPADGEMARLLKAVTIRALPASRDASNPGEKEER